MRRIKCTAPTIPLLLFETQSKYPNAVAQYAKDSLNIFKAHSFSNLAKDFSAFGAGLYSIGIKRGDAVGLISDNCREWLIADLGLLSIGAVDVPRGTDTFPQELSYILGFCNCSHCIVENNIQLKKIISILDSLPLLKQIIVLNPDSDLEQIPLSPGISLWSFETILNQGTNFLANDPEFISQECIKTTSHDLATIIFTSGTTGEPKGVMLSHNNLLHQVRGVIDKIDISSKDIWLCILPVWHSFERIMQYVALGYGSALAYSKPNAKILLADLQQIRPSWMAAVPRVWDALRQGIVSKVNTDGGIKKILFHFFIGLGTVHAQLETKLRGLEANFTRRLIFLEALGAFFPWLLLLPLRLLGQLLVYSKIKQRLGGRFKAGISGGGALAAPVDSFYQSIGICVLEGYGLTESAPVISVRTRWRPVPGTVGSPLAGTEIQVRSESGDILLPGERGVLFVRGPQVMKGYYKKPLKTREIISNDGWLNTGDLAMISWNQEIKIVGRSKDTIVLSGGENVEPLPIESALAESLFIYQCILLGQDQKFLGALIIPNQDRTIAWATEHNIQYDDYVELIKNPQIIKLFSDDIARLISEKHGFRPFEQIYRFTLLAKPFEVGKELSAKQDIKRHYIGDVYSRQINAMFGVKE